MIRLCRHVTAQRVGDVETGGWCDDCALPSMVTVDLVISVGLATLEARRVVWCDECGAVTHRTHVA